MFNAVTIGKDIIKSTLPPLLSEYAVQRVCLVSDRNTYEAAGREAASIIRGQGIALTDICLPDEEPVPDETLLGKILMQMDMHTDFMIGAGAGTLNDICKFISSRLGIPYVIIATAPSVDGFASTGAALITENAKVTYDAHSPVAILADTTVLENAPERMLLAGIGDMLGKYTCLCDWKLSHIINGETYDADIAENIKQSVEQIYSFDSPQDYRTAGSLSLIMHALINSGLAMQKVGNSRPASGSEHHLSHYWEMLHLMEHKPSELHGIKVAVGTVVVLKAYELLLHYPLDFQKARDKAAAYDFEAWKCEIGEAYGNAAASVIALETKVRKNSRDILKRIDRIQGNWNRIRLCITDSLPSSAAMIDYFRRLGLPYAPQQIGITIPETVNALLYAKDVRDRYGLLQLLFDLGINYEVAEQAGKFFAAL